MPKPRNKIQRVPNVLNDTYDAGIVEFIRHNYKAAAEHFGAVLEIEPDHQGALHHRGHAYRKLKQPAKGFDDLARVTDPKYKRKP